MSPIMVGPGGATRDDSDLGEVAPGRRAAEGALVRIGHLGELHRDRALLVLLPSAAPRQTIELLRGDTDSVASGAAGWPERLEVADEWMSRPHARLIPAGGGELWLEDAGSRNGVMLLVPSDTGGSPARAARAGRITRHRLRHGDLFVTGRTAWRYCGERIEDPAELVALSARPFGPSRSVAPAYLRAVRLLARAATSTLSVLVTGPSGAGKEVAARELHARSGRSGKLVAVNCAALPEGMVEGQLFGHRKGAFTGATEGSPGLILSAHGGTLLLDEIGDMPLAAQAKLLRVLEEREVLALGDVTPRKVDVRVIAATHADLRVRVQEGRFRGDLLARLAQVTVRLPALHERREDLGTLLPVLLGPLGAHPTVEAARALLLHGWPYQIRELASSLASAALLAGASAAGPAAIRLEHLPEMIREAGHPEAIPAAPDEARPEGSGDAGGAARTARSDAAAAAARRPSRAELEELLRRHHGNVTAAAQEVGKGKMQIYRWLRHHGLDPDRFR
jgi:DNA-binding NtrC family response regulator